MTCYHFDAMSIDSVHCENVEAMQIGCHIELLECRFSCCFTYFLCVRFKSNELIITYNKHLQFLMLLLTDMSLT